MIGNKAKRVITIVERSYPPNPSFTGESAADLAQFLISRDFEVNIVYSPVPYKGGTNSIEPVGNLFPVKSQKPGKNKYTRLFADLLEGYSMIRKAKRIPTDTYIIMTSPPLLGVWASILLTKKTKWIYWTMDLYPQAFVAAHLVTKQNLIYRSITFLQKRNSPTAIINLGEEQQKYTQTLFPDSFHLFLLPCGVQEQYNVTYQAKENFFKGSGSKILFCYVGNLGEAHSDSFLIHIIDNLNPKKHVLLLGVYGAKSYKITEHLNGMPDTSHILQPKNITREQLSLVDIHLVSLLPEWTHICVPSKAMSAVTSGSTFLFYGDEASDNWQMLKESGWIIPCIEADSKDDYKNIKTFLDLINPDEIKSKKMNSNKLSIHLKEMKSNTYSLIEQYLRNVKN